VSPTRNGIRYVARLAAARPPAAAGAPYRLEIRERGSFDRLEVAPMERRAPAAGEVEIAVRATALNFRDVLNTLGLYPGDPGPLGGELRRHRDGGRRRRHRATAR